ncbi:MAG: NADH-ubiquinone oxidoreductase-F iron-sulfur binding region domain-containing protein [Desulfosudaceae bacterium]
MAETKADPENENPADGNAVDLKETETDQRYQSLKQKAVDKWDSFTRSATPTIHIGMATCGLASGAEETRQAFEENLKKEGLEAVIHPIGCHGHCYAEPLVIVNVPESGYPPIMYQNVNEGKARMLVKNFIGAHDPCFDHIYGAVTEDSEAIPSLMLFPRFNREKRVIMEKCGQINPAEIDEYLAWGGYASLTAALDMESSDIIQIISDSGLRGRGGAGFPTGRKWAIAAAQDNPEKIVICNADEGDPGAYMDRTLLESNPHQMLEGLAVCARAIGARRGIVYVRAEYPLAVRLITKAINQAREYNLLGDNILGSDFSLEIEVFQGSGAFVCGEETSLIRSLEGFRGMPRHRPPFPVTSGLHGRPTVINNVKTLSTVPPIIDKGVDWFRGIGTGDSPGTAIFSIVGHVLFAGLVEIPMGESLRTLIFDICGGIPDKKKFKAVQIGGPSGGCLPESFLDTPIDFDSLTEAGAMMGSGGMVIMNEDTCMVNVSRYFLEFTQNESCGKCTFCRIGTRHLLQILDRITKGEGQEEDLDTLAWLAASVKQGSLCGLGKTAPNPVLTSLEYFRDEYEAHVKDKICPAKMCRDLIAYYIDLDLCARGCDACVGSCPTEAIFTTPNRKKGIDQEKCVKCGECMTVCIPLYDAVKKATPPENAPIVENPKKEEG